MEEKEQNELQKEKEEIARITEEVNKQEEERKQQELEKEREEKINLEQEKEKNKEASSLQNKYIVLAVLLLAIFGCLILAYKVILNKPEEAPGTDAPLEERIAYILKKRYGKEFSLVSSNVYQDENNVKFSIQTNENTSAKLIVFDDYLNELHVNKITSKISNYLTKNGLTNVTVNLAPAHDCHFVGACISNDAYYANYKENTDETLLSARSDEINFKDYVSLSNVDFFNTYQFSITIKIVGNYTEADRYNFRTILQGLFTELNEGGYENNLGYEIIVKDVEGISDVMQFTGEGTASKTYNLHDGIEK